MDNARAFIDSYNSIAQDWARNQTGRALSSVPPVRGVAYRRIWPSDQVMESLHQFEHDTALAGGNGWLDSTLDLRDGLSVIEVYADPDPASVPKFTLDMSAMSL